MAIKTADVAEASQRLDQFRIDLATRTSGVITTERQLRNVLGLPPADGRRIVPVTAPVDAKLEPDWDACLAAMLEKQPDVVRAKETAKSKGVDLDAIARSFLPDLVAKGPFAPALGNPALLGSAALQQTTREATYALNRFFQELEADYKQYEAAKRLRSAAAERLAAQRAYFDDGRITIDRYLDAVSQFAQASAREAQFKAVYNIAIVALEEAKGTLLEYEKIAVVASPKGGGSASVAPVASSTSMIPPPVHDAGTPASAVTPKPAPPAGASGARTIAFQATIRLGPVPVAIQGSFTIGDAAGP